jgi:hypothetical protein
VTQGACPHRFALAGASAGGEATLNRGYKMGAPMSSAQTGRPRQRAALAAGATMRNADPTEAVAALWENRRRETP